MLKNREDGHTWTEHAWGYATRNCGFGLPCNCQQPKTPDEGPPTFDMRTRQMAGKSRETPTEDRTERASRKLASIGTRKKAHAGAAAPAL